MLIRVMLVFILTSASAVTNAADKKIGILVWDGVLTSDITAPLEVFGQASTLSWFSDYSVTLINVSSKDVIQTHEGIRLNVDSHLKEKPAVDVLIVPSAYEMDPLVSNTSLIEYIKNTATTAEWMASNCSGAFLLAEAGILDGKKATTWAGGEKQLKKAYPKVNVQFDTNVVVDKGVITSNGSLVSYQAALKLLSQIASPDKAEEVAGALQYARFSSKNFN